MLFTDIVDSTRHLATQGDRHWRALLAQYYAILRDGLERFRSREIDTKLSISERISLGGVLAQYEVFQ